MLTSFYGPDGIYPSGKLAMDTSGNLYGTTTYGGPYSLGTVFKVDTSGTKTVIYNFIFDDEEFLLDTHGAYPLAGLIMDNKAVSMAPHLTAALMAGGQCSRSYKRHTDSAPQFHRREYRPGISSIRVDPE